MPDEPPERAFAASDEDAASQASLALLTSVLDPMERISEVLFGLIMVLTFTGSIEVATAGRAGVRSILLGALSCNLAWGIIDGCMYMMARLHERGRRLTVLRAVRDATNLNLAQKLIAEALPPLIASLLPREQLELLRGRLRQLPEPPAAYVLPGRRDWIGAVAVGLLVFLSTLPVVIPFIFVEDVAIALRTSNAVAITMMFLLGWAFGHVAGLRPVPMGLAMTLVGLALVALAISLGG